MRLSDWPAIRRRILDIGFGALTVFAVTEGIIQWPNKHELFAAAIICGVILADRVLRRHWRYYR